MMIDGKYYEIIEYIHIGNMSIPLLDIPYMTDERWNELASLHQPEQKN